MKERTEVQSNTQVRDRFDIGDIADRGISPKKTIESKDVVAKAEPSEIWKRFVDEMNA